MADPRLTVVKMLMKMDSSEAYSNLLLDHVFSETDLSERDKAFAAALFYGVLERRLTLDYIIEKNSKIPGSADGDANCQHVEAIMESSKHRLQGKLQQAAHRMVYDSVLQR